MQRRGGSGRIRPFAFRGPRRQSRTQISTRPIRRHRVLVLGGPELRPGGGSERLEPELSHDLVGQHAFHARGVENEAVVHARDFPISSGARKG